MNDKPIDSLVQYETLNERVLRHAKNLRSKSNQKEHWAADWDGNQLEVFLTHFEIKTSGVRNLRSLSGIYFLNLCVEEAVALFSNNATSIGRTSELGRLIPSSIQRKKVLRLFLLHENLPDSGVIANRLRFNSEEWKNVRQGNKHLPRVQKPAGQLPQRTSRSNQYIKSGNQTRDIAIPTNRNQKSAMCVSPCRPPEMHHQHSAPPSTYRVIKGQPEVNSEALELLILDALMSQYQGNFESRFAPRVFEQLAYDKTGEITSLSLKHAIQHLGLQKQKRTTVESLVRSWGDGYRDSVSFDQFRKNVLERQGIVDSSVDHSQSNSWYLAYEQELPKHLIDILVEALQHCPRLQQAFFPFDSMNSGVVSPEGFLEGLGKLGVELSDTQASLLCSCFVERKSRYGVDYVLFSEFMAETLRRVRKADPLKHAYNSFQKQDGELTQGYQTHTPRKWGTGINRGALQPPPISTQIASKGSKSPNAWDPNSNHPALRESNKGAYKSRENEQSALNSGRNLQQHSDQINLEVADPSQTVAQLRLALERETNQIDHNLHLALQVQQRNPLDYFPGSKCRLQVSLGESNIIHAFHELQQYYQAELLLENDNGEKEFNRFNDEVWGLAEEYNNIVKSEKKLGVHVVLTSCALAFNPPRFELNIEQPIQTIQVQATLKCESNSEACEGCSQCKVDRRHTKCENRTGASQYANEQQPKEKEKVKCLVHLFVGPLPIGTFPLNLSTDTSFRDADLGGLRSPMSIGSTTEQSPVVKSSFFKIGGEFLVAGWEDEWVGKALQQSLSAIRRSKVADLSILHLDFTRSHRWNREMVADANEVVLMWSPHTRESTQVEFALEAISQELEQLDKQPSDGSTKVFQRLPVVKLVYWEHPRPEVPSRIARLAKSHNISVVFHNSWQLDRSSAPVVQPPKQTNPFAGVGVSKQANTGVVARPGKVSEQTMRKPGGPVSILRKGDRVFARFARQSSYLAGAISSANENGTFNIAYDNGEVEFQVRSRYIRKAESWAGSVTTRDTDQETKRMHESEALAWGTQVKVRSHSGELLFGRISKYLPMSHYYIVAMNTGGDLRVHARNVEPASGKSNASARQAVRTYVDAIADNLVALIKSAASIDPNGTNLRAQFERLDASGTGKISYKDFEIGLSKVGFKASPEDLHELMDRMDANNDGYVDYGEFVRFALPNGVPDDVGTSIDFSSRTNLPSKLKSAGLEPLIEELRAQMQGVGYIWDTFRSFDKNNNGELDEEEFRTAVMMCGFKLSREQTQSLMKALDFDSNGAIAYKEFVTFLEGYNASFLIQDKPCGSSRTSHSDTEEEESTDDEEEKSGSLPSHVLKKRRQLKRERKAQLKHENKSASKIQALARGYQSRKVSAIKLAETKIERYRASKITKASHHDVPQNLNSRHWMLCGDVTDHEEQGGNVGHEAKAIEEQQSKPKAVGSGTTMHPVLPDNRRIERILEQIRTILKRNSRGGAKVRSLFRFMDRDMDGYIGVEDLMHSLHRFGVHLDKQSISRVIYCYDFDCDCKLCGDELEALVEGGVSRVKEEVSRESQFIHLLEKLGSNLFTKLEKYSQFLAQKTVNPPNLVQLFCSKDTKKNGMIHSEELFGVLQRLGYKILNHEKKIIVETFGSRISDMVDYRKFLSALLCRNYGHLSAILEQDINKALGITDNQESSKHDHLRKCLERLAVFSMQQAVQVEKNDAKTKSKYSSPKERCRQHLTSLLMQNSKSVSMMEFANMLVLCGKSRKLYRLNETEARAIAEHFGDTTSGEDVVTVSAFIDYVALVAGRLGALGRKKQKGKKGKFDPASLLDSPRHDHASTPTRSAETSLSSLAIVLDSLNEYDRRKFGVLLGRLQTDVRVKAQQREIQFTQSWSSLGRETGHSFGLAGFQRKVGKAANRREAAEAILADYIIVNGPVLDKTELDLLIARLELNFTPPELQLLCRVIAFQHSGLGANAGNSQHLAFDAQLLAEVLGAKYDSYLERFGRANRERSQKQNRSSDPGHNASEQQEAAQLTATIGRIKRTKTSDKIRMARQVGCEAFHAQVHEQLGPTLADKVQTAIMNAFKTGRWSLGCRRWYSRKLQSQMSAHQEPGISQRTHAIPASGQVSSKHLMQSIAESGLKLSEKDIESLFSALGVDKKGNVVLAYVSDFFMTSAILDDRARCYHQQADARKRVRKVLEKLAGIVKQTEQAKRFRFLQTFKAMDQSGDGFITGEELRASLLSIGLKIEESDHRLILQAFDSNHDGRINYKEFVEFVDSMDDHSDSATPEAANMKQLLAQSVVQQLVFQLSPISAYQFYNWLPSLRHQEERRTSAVYQKRNHKAHLISSALLAELLQDLGVALSASEVATLLGHFANSASSTGKEASSKRLVLSKHSVELIMVQLFKESKKVSTTNNSHSKSVRNRVLFHDHKVIGQLVPNTSILLVSGPAWNRLRGSGKQYGKAIDKELPGRVAKAREAPNRYDLLMNDGTVVPNVERRYLRLSGPDVRNEYSVGSEVTVTIPPQFAGAGTYKGKVVREHVQNSSFDVSATRVDSCGQVEEPGQTANVLQKIPLSFLSPPSRNEQGSGEPFRVDSRIIIYGTEVEVIESVFGGVAAAHETEKSSQNKFVRGTVVQVQSDGRFTVEFEHGERVTNIGMSEIR